jgi:hypothetical protein
VDILEKIQAETEERKLLAYAYSCHGGMMSGQMFSKDYAECMVLLTEKLGFPPLEENLAKAASKYFSAS